MTAPSNPQQHIKNLICEIADALESMNPRHPLRNFCARLFFSPKKRLDRAARRIEGSAAAFDAAPGYPRFVAAYKKMVDALDSLDSQPFNLAAMNEVIEILNCLNRAGILTDAQKQEAVRARHALDEVSVEETYEDSGGMSGSDPCPPTTYTVTHTPARLDF